MTLTRRERVRQQTLAEIKQHAQEQIAEGGVAGLSLNAIARAMGMSGPAIYRYYASRDELLGELTFDAFGELTERLRETAAATARRAPARRLDAVGDAYRGWALEQPARYGLLFGARTDGRADPDEAIRVIDGAMVVLLELLGALAASADGAGATARGRGRGGSLDSQLVRWSRDRELPADDPRVLRLGVLAWTRIHGIVGLELAGALPAGIDGRLLLQAELAQVVAAATA